MKKQLFKKLSVALALTAVCNSNTLKAQVGAAINFDGVNDIVNTGSAITSSLVNTNQITVEAWVKPTVNTGLGAIVGNYSTSGAGMQFLLRRENGNFAFWTSNGVFNNIVAVGTVTLNTWTHLAGTWDGATMRLYVNGALTTSSAVTGSFTPFSAPVWVGGETAGGGEYFNGDIDEVRIWKVARSQADIQNSRNCEINGPSANLIANYHFNQGIAAGNNTAVTTAIDDSGNANTGTLTAMTLTSTTSNWVTPGGVTSGVSCNGAALNFTNTPSNSVVLPSAISTSLSTSNKLTVEAWVRPRTVGGAARTVIGNYSTPSNQAQFFIRAIPTGYQFFVGNSSTGVYTGVVSVAAPTLNVWQHVAGVWNGTVSSIYINGVLSGTVGVTYSNLGVNSNSTVIGSNAVPENWDGDIDEVRIWNRALCQGEIQNNRNGEIATSANGLLANYHFNQGIAACTNTSVTTLTDASGNAYTGTLTGIALTSGTVSNWVTPGGVASGSNVVAFVSPTVAISGASSICSGSSTTLTASGVSSYSWTSGPNTATYAVTPTLTTTYSVVGTATNGCVSSLATKTIVVNSIPTVSVNSGSVCAGNTFTIAPSGASTYTIQGGSSAVSPTANASYTVVGTSSVGCVSANTATSNVTVNANPTISAVSSATNFICAGQSATLTASGATTYTWNTSATTAVIAISPTTNTTYTVNGTNANGCSNVALITQSVSACTGIKSSNINQSLAINVYPNPSTGVFNLDVTDNMLIEVTDVLGNVVLTEKLNAGNYALNLTNNAKGLYIIKASSNGESKTIKIIKE